MKKFITLGLLTLSGMAGAVDRDIYDIMYLPRSGTSYGFTTGELTNLERQSNEEGDVDFEGFAVSQTLGHSFTDRFSLAADINYTNIEADPDGRSKFDAAEGLSDPRVTARFRTVDETFRWDIIGGAVLNIMDREIQRNGDTDNVQGGHSLFAGTQFGSKTQNFQWALTGLIIHNFEAESEVEQGNGRKVIVEDDSNNELLVRGDILNRLAAKHFLRWNAEARFAEDFDNDQSPKETTPAQTNYQAGLEYQHLMSKDMLLRAGADYQMINVRTGQIDDFDGWVFRVGANYQF